MSKLAAGFAFILLVSTLVAVLPVAAKIVDYGGEGWLWALFGLCQRQYVDDISAAGSVGETQRSSASALAATESAGLMRLLACLVAALVFVWQEQEEFSFPAIHLAVFILGLGVLSISLCLFKRGESRIQPPEPIAGALRFHRSAHFGNLRHPACRLRTPCKVAARSRPLTRDSRTKHLPCDTSGRAAFARTATGIRVTAQFDLRTGRRTLVEQKVYDRIKLCISDKAQYGEAVADVRRAIKLAPGSDDVADFAGFVLAPSGYLEEAAKTSVEPGLKLNWSLRLTYRPIEA